MNDLSPGMRPLFIDQEGNLRVEPVPVAVLNGRSGNWQRLAEYAVKNLDLVQVWRSGRGLRVRFRPERISAEALSRLLYLLSDAPPTRVALEYFTDGWHHELVGSRHAAISRLVALVDNAMQTDAASCVLCQPVEPAALRDRSPLHDLVENWSPRFSTRGLARLMRRAYERTGGRFVLFEHDRDRDAFLFRDFGVGIPEWAKYSLAAFRGRALGDLHDDQFGRSCSFAYRDALEKLAPTVQICDAKIRWPKYGTRRSCYWRLVLPMADPAGRFWLLSTTLADASIDLRKTG